MMAGAVFLVKACRANVEEALNFICSELEAHHFPASLQSDILVAVEEIFVNIASYAFEPNQEKDVTISVSVGREAVIRFEDAGRPFNPWDQSGPDLDIPLTEREIGGLGIYLAKKLMDKVEYEYTGGKNILTITKEASRKEEK